MKPFSAVVETRHDLALTLPKNRRRENTTMYRPAPRRRRRGRLLARRLAQIGPEDLLFPSPKAAGPGVPTTRRKPSS